MGLMKKLTSAIVASSLVLSLVGSAFAAYTPAAGETAGNRMQALGMLQGRPGEGLALNAEITRAELVTVIVRAFGQEENAKLLAGAAAYPDTATHWASGNIAMAKALIEKQGDSMGMPDGTFAPDAKLTPAQAVAFLMKFLGVKRDATQSWPMDYLGAAVTAGLITSADKDIIAPMLNDNATRGLVFYVFDNAFYSYDLGAGKTFYTKYVDTTAPVLTLNTVPATTLDSKVTISGKAEGAKEVYVGTNSVTVAADGTFSTEFALPEMKEYSITVTARDVAGNVTEKAATITRAVGAIAKIEAAAITVAAGATVDVAAKAVDAMGNAVVNAAITGESGVGTFAAGKFTAGKVAGTGKLKLMVGEIAAEVDVTVVAGPLAKIAADKASVAPGTIVTLSAQDEHGNAITGATFAQTSANAMVDATTGKFMASSAGSYTVTATKDGVTVETKVGVYSSTLSKFGVTASAASVIANQASEFTVTVRAQDSNGNFIANNTASFTWDAAAQSLFQYKNASGSFVDLETGAIALVDGTKTFTLRTKTGVLGGQIAEVGVTQSGVVADAKSGKTTIELIDQVATSIKLSTSDKFVANNAGTENAKFKVEVMDQAGKLMQTGAWAVKATVTGPAVLVDSVGDENPAASKDLTFTGGAGTDIFVRSKLGEAGTVTVTATVEGFAAANASVTATAAQIASKLEVTSDVTTAVANSQEWITYTVKVTDAQGVPIGADRDDVFAKITLGDDDLAEVSYRVWADSTVGNTGYTTAAPIPAAKEFELEFKTDGTAKFQLRAHKFVGDVKVAFADKAASNKVTGPESTVSFKADEAKEIGLLRTADIAVPATNPTVTLTAQLYDLAGNVSKTAGKKITFSSTNDDVKLNGGGKTVDVLTDAEGKATVNVTVLGYVGAAYEYTINVTGATNSGISAVAAAASVKVIPSNAVATSMTLAVLNSLGNQTGTATADDVLTLRVTPKDAAGKVLFDQTHEVKVTEGKTVTTVTVAHVANGVYEGTFRPKTAGRLTLQVKNTSSATEVTAPISISVRAAAFDGVVVERSDYTSLALDTTSGAAKAFRIIPVDLHGNLSARTAGAVTVTFTVDTGTVDANKYFEIRTSADGANLLNASGIATLDLAAGSTGRTFYVLTNDTTGVSVTITTNHGDGGDDTKVLVFTGK